MQASRLEFRLKAVLAAVLMVTAVAFGGDKLYVVNSLDESLGWIDLSDWDSDPQAATLGFIPNEIVALTNVLCVINSGDNNVQVIDAVTLQTIRLIELPGAVNAFAATELPGNRLAVTATLSGTVSIVDWSTGQADTTFYTGVGPQFVATAGGMLYVLCTGVEFPIFGTGVLKRYDIDTYELIDSLDVGINPQSLLFAWNYEVHVLCTGNYDDVEGSVVVVNVEDEMEIDTVLNVGGSPISMALGSAPGIGSGWIAAGGWGTEGFVYQYNAVEHEILHGEENPIVTGIGAVDIEAQGYEGGSLFVSCFNQNTIQVLSCNGIPAQTIEMSAGPGSLAIWHEPVAVSPEVGISRPDDINILTTYPNPFNGTLNLALSTPARLSTSVAVFDLLGRKVGTIPVSAGERLVQWRPGTAGWAEVSAGVYFARLGGDILTLPARIVYIK